MPSFFRDPSKYEVISRSSGLPKAFFWQRGREVTWDTVRKLIGTPGVMESVQLHLAADPGRSTGAPDERESQLFRIAQSEWFSTRKDYLSAISKAEVFFAPRIREGIGLSFLEAMAYGACVVAPDLPTMNEYIIHGKTGLFMILSIPVRWTFPVHAQLGRTPVSLLKQAMSGGSLTRARSWSSSIRRALLADRHPDFLFCGRPWVHATDCDG